VDRVTRKIREDLEPLGPASPKVRVAVADGLPDLKIEELDRAAIETECSMVPDDCWSPDAHATEIFSLIFGLEHGIATGSHGLALPVFFRGRAGHATPRASQMDVARALHLSLERGVDIVNISAGQKSDTTEASRHLEDAIARCGREHVLVVAAAGNDGCACLHVPAAVPTVLAVGAMDDIGRPLDRSNWGESYAKNGILAPGVGIDVIGLSDEPHLRTGTSYAAAVVSGIAARMLSAARERQSSMTADEIRTILIETADPCDPSEESDCAKILAGRLNLPAAIERFFQSSRGVLSHPTRLFNQHPEAGGEQQMDSATPTETIVPSNAGTRPAIDLGIEQLGCGCGGQGECTCQTTKEEDRQSDEIARGLAGLEDARNDESPTMSQQGCACGEQQEARLVYSIGALWFDFGSEARYDAIVQQMGDPIAANNPNALFEFLSDNLAFASGITFILMQDQIPVYAIQPAGPFAQEMYTSMLEALSSSVDPTGDLQRVAIPGIISGTTRLMNGMTLPVIYPDIRGMVKWQAAELTAAAKAAIGAEDVDEDSIFNFLIRVYDELRNFGISAEERALNFAATNAYQAATAFADGMRRKLELYRIGVKKSPICRPDSDCWDVQLVMFDPENERRAGRFYRFTVDVSETLPVTVGTMRVWNAPLTLV